MTEFPPKIRYPKYGYVFKDYYNYWVLKGKNPVILVLPFFADAYAWFEEHGGLTRENGDRLRRMVLSRGNTGDPAELYRAWRGRDAEIGPMLAGRGIELLANADSVAA